MNVNKRRLIITICLTLLLMCFTHSALADEVEESTWQIISERVVSADRDKIVEPDAEKPYRTSYLTKYGLCYQQGSSLYMYQPMVTSAGEFYYYSDGWKFFPGDALIDPVGNTLVTFYCDVYGSSNFKTNISTSSSTLQTGRIIRFNASQIGGIGDISYYYDIFDMSELKHESSFGSYDDYYYEKVMSYPESGRRGINNSSFIHKFDEPGTYWVFVAAVDADDNVSHYARCVVEIEQGPEGIDELPDEMIFQRTASSYYSTSYYSEPYSTDYFTKYGVKYNHGKDLYDWKYENGPAYYSEGYRYSVSITEPGCGSFYPIGGVISYLAKMHDPEDFTIKLSVSSDTKLITGYPITFSCSSTGGSGEISYLYDIYNTSEMYPSGAVRGGNYYKRIASFPSTSTDRDVTGNNSFTYTFPEDGVYWIFACAIDENNQLSQYDQLRIKITGATASITDETDFILPAGLTMIENEAFQGVQASVILIPEGVTSIGDKAFADCILLREIYIPAGVTRFGDDIFLNTVDLTIYGKQNSPAEMYANDNGICFVATSLSNYNYQKEGGTTVDDEKDFDD